MSISVDLFDWSISNCLRKLFLSNVSGSGAVDSMHARNCCSLYDSTKFGGCLVFDSAVGFKTLTVIHSIQVMPPSEFIEIRRKHVFGNLR